MQTSDLPFNIVIMKVDKEKVKTLKPVSTTDIMKSSGQSLLPEDLAPEGEIMTWGGQNGLSSNFNEDGLFSVSIFGRIGEPERDNRFSFINIKAGVFHPLIFKALNKINKLYGQIMSSKAHAIWDDKLKDFVRSDEMEGKTGYSFFISHWRDIKFIENRSPTRTQKITLIKKYKDIALTDRVLVLPAGLRDVRVGSNNRLEFDEINDIYRKIINVSRTISIGNNDANNTSFNYGRYQIQMAFNELYDQLENLLSGKKGFFQSKWGKRKVFNGTRNVISSMDSSKDIMGDPNSFKSTDTIVGLFQFLRGVLPYALNRIRNKYLSDAMGIGNTSNTVILVDPVSLKRETVDIDPLTKDRWTTVDGLEKVINSFDQPELRHKPIKIEGRYLALVYKGPDKTFRVFNDISELPETFDKKYVFPMTLTELLYLSGYQDWYKTKVIVTRYPVTGLGSSYPSDVYVKTTHTGEKRMELGYDWKPMGEDFIAKEFPDSSSDEFFSSTNVSPVRMEGLGAD